MNRILATLCVAAVVAPGFSAQADSLMEIYQRAVINDPAIREAEANMYATMETRPQARADLLPQLDFNSNWNKTKSDGSRVTFVLGQPFSQPFESDTDSLNWSFDLNQTLFRWDQFQRMGKAGQEVSQAQLDYGAAGQDLMIRVAEAYFDVLAAQDTLESNTAAKEAIERQLEQANRRFEVGLIAITDVQESQAGFDDAVATEIVSKRELANAREALREITGEYPELLAEPADEFPLIMPEPAVQDQWVDTAIAQNLEVLSAKIGTELTRYDVKIARNGHLPTLDLSASYGNRKLEGNSTQNVVDFPITDPPTFSPNSITLDTDQTDKSIGLQLKFPIFAGMGVSSEVKEAVYRHRASKENFEKVIRQTQRETRDAYYGVESEISRVKALRQARKSNQVALEATEAGYEVGTRTTVDVLDARRNLFLAETNYARSRYDYIVNVLKLKRAAGTLSPDDLQAVDNYLQK